MRSGLLFFDQICHGCIQFLPCGILSWSRDGVIPSIPFGTSARMLPEPINECGLVHGIATIPKILSTHAVVWRFPTNSRHLSAVRIRGTVPNCFLGSALIRSESQFWPYGLLDPILCALESRAKSGKCILCDTGGILCRIIGEVSHIIEINRCKASNASPSQVIAKFPKRHCGMENSRMNTRQLSFPCIGIPIVGEQSIFLVRIRRPVWRNTRQRR